MSITTTRYFHSASLRQRYIDELDAALSDLRLHTVEQLWLLDVVRPLVAGDADPVRVDRITFSGGSIQPFELAGGLLLSHGLTDNRRVYLYTLSYGIEVFHDRHGLLAVLRARFAAGDVNALFEYERIEGDPFRAQMLAIVDQEVALVARLTAQLKVTPSLLEACTASLTRQLRATPELASIDPHVQLLHIVPASNADTETIPLTQTLAHAAFDDCRNVTLAPGYARRFLDAQGLQATAASTVSFAQALAEAVTKTAHHYGQLLQTFWGAAPSGQTQGRDLAIESIRRSLFREYNRCKHDKTLSPDALGVVLSLIHSMSDCEPEGSTLRCHRMTLRVGGGKACPLAGTFVVEHKADADGSLLWFSPEHRLVRFRDVLALTAFLRTAQGRKRLRPALAIEDQSILMAEGQIQVDLERISTSVLPERVDSIIALQARNLQYAMNLSTEPDRKTAMIDDALDIRQLIDPRQLKLSAGRWRLDLPFVFSDVWPQSQTDASATTGPLTVTGDNRSGGPAGSIMGANVASTLRVSWLEQAQDLDLRAARLQRPQSTLREYAEHVLQQYVCVLIGETTSVTSIRLQWLESAIADPTDVETRAVPISESQQVVSVDLVRWLIECISGNRSHAVGANVHVLVDSSPLPGRVQVELINHMLEQLTGCFAQRYIECVTRSFVEFRRQGSLQLQAFSEALRLREGAMRLDFALRVREGWIDGNATAIVRQVLGRPVRSLRLASGAPLIEAFTVSLQCGEQPGAFLGETLVLRQSSNSASPVLLWSGEFGWRQFTSLQHLHSILKSKFLGEKRARWLALFAERDNARMRHLLAQSTATQMQIILHRADGHAIEALQQIAQDRVQQNLEALCSRAVRCHFEAELFNRLAVATERDELLKNTLDTLSVRIGNSLFEALMPEWFSMASVHDLGLFYGTLRRYLQASNGGKDFLFAIPTLQDFTREKLAAQLKKDFIGQSFDPDTITLTSRRYVIASPALGEVPSAIPAATSVHSESLTDYAINRFVNEQGSVFSVDSADCPQAAHLLTPAYLRRLVRQLDVGAGYTALLRSAFAPDHPEYATRKRIYFAQMPLILQAMALPEKVVGALSETGYAYLTQVVEMPDGIARSPVDGVKVILSPLQLVADAGMTPDPVAGVYLICPEAVDRGPIILYAVYNPSFTFREYDSQTALLDDIRSDESLQRLLLERLDPEVHRRYAYGGFTEPHLPYSAGLYEVPLRAPGPVTLGISAVNGNALNYLFQGAVDLLIHASQSNVVTNEQAEHADRLFLTTLAFEQTMALLPGKLGTLMGLWQSHTLFSASALSASDHRWGKALSEFSAALGAVIAAREQVIDEKVTEDQQSTGPDGPSSNPDQPQQSPTGFSWREAGLSAEQSMRLRGLEAKQVALSEMRYDDLFNLYVDKYDNHYAAVAGKVYQVGLLPDNGGAFIVGADGTQGPRLRLDIAQHWQLDLDLRLRGGGGVVTKLNAVSADRVADTVLVVQAKGMSEIRALYRDRARHIAQAHMQARNYLQNCLDNLNLRGQAGTLDSRVSRIIGDFFGIATPDTALISRIEGAIKTLFDSVMDPTLSPFSSTRFVVGYNRPGREAVIAFVVKADPMRQVFLTDRFFDVPTFALSPQAAAEAFNATDHYQAANLMHELSHQALDTHDVAYLEAMAPYPDLLLENTPCNAGLRAYVARLHEYRLSHRSQKKELFTTYENGLWVDIKPGNDSGFETILRITNTNNLDAARDIFLSDIHVRSQIILSNADSLTLLVVRLGRYNYVTSGP